MSIAKHTEIVDRTIAVASFSLGFFENYDALYLEGGEGLPSELPLEIILNPKIFSVKITFKFKIITMS